MPFSSLGNDEQIRVIMLLENAAAYIAKMTESAAATARLAASQRALATSTKESNAQSFIQRQGMYTARRYAFYATLAITGLAAAVFRLGLSYYNTTQTAMVGFKGMLGSAAAARKELDQLYILAAASPFQFPDIVNAARLLQPYTNNIRLTNQVVKDLTNTLSAAGQLSASAMQRASLQLSHMFTVGRLTGQILLSLGRDFVPMNIALQQSLHMTGDQIRREVAGGYISARIAAKALHDYVMSDGARSTAAFNQSTQTLVGSWSTLKDLIGMSASGASGGIFESLRKTIKGVDQQLLLMADTGRHITMTDLITAIDARLTPGTHALLNSFILLNSAIHTSVTEFGLLLYPVFKILDLIGRLTSLFGSNRIAARLLGIVFGTLITLWTIGKIRLMALSEWQVIAGITSKGFGRSVLITNGIMKAFNLIMAGEAISALRGWAFASRQAGYAGAVLGEQELINTGLGAKLTRAIFGIVPALTSATAASWGFLAANIWWVGIIAAVVALTAGIVILYFKWKAFHDLVNRSFDYIVHNRVAIQAALFSIFAPVILAAQAIQSFVNNADRVRHMFVNTARTVTMPPGTAYAPNRSAPHHENWFQRNIADPFRVVSGFASGGSPGMFGNYMVGESGPEILNLPRGASVTPLDNSHLAGTIEVKVFPQDIYMDGKKVGYAVSTAYTDTTARQ